MCVCVCMCMCVCTCLEVRLEALSFKQLSYKASGKLERAFILTGC